MRVAFDSGIWGSSGLINYLGVGVSLDESDPYEWAKKSHGLIPFAIVKNGVWYENVCQTRRDWGGEYCKLLDDVPDDHWLTIVDCHI